MYKLEAYSWTRPKLAQVGTLHRAWGRICYRCKNQACDNIFSHKNKNIKKGKATREYTEYMYK
jgi:hypothetical protein